MEVCFGIAVLAILVGVLKVSFDKKAKLERKKKARSATQHQIGRQIKNRRAALQTARAVLPHFHQLGFESAAVLFLDDNNNCVHSEVRFGDETSVALPQAELFSACKRTGASKLVLMHNHPDNRAMPSDADVEYAADLYEGLPDDVSLVDDFVWCRNEIKSVLNTKRFKQLVRPY
jgi:DNA repair protein RadC